MGCQNMNEFVQSVFTLLGALTIIKLLILKIFGIIETIISEVNGVLLKIKKVQNNINKN